MNVLDLFSGSGAFNVGLERAGMQPVAFCEIDPWCQSVLRKWWPDVPCFDDVRRIDASRLGGLDAFDLVAGGFPCQPYSGAGKQLGARDPRDLWPETRRVIELSRPTWFIGENVTRLISLGLDDVLDDLEALGYATWPVGLPACAVGAPHRRERLFIIAYSERSQLARKEPCSRPARRVGRFEQSVSWDTPWQDSLRFFRGMDDGHAYGVDRVDAIRNAVVPALIEEIGKAILGSQP